MPPSLVSFIHFFVKGVHKRITTFVNRRRGLKRRRFTIALVSMGLVMAFFLSSMSLTVVASPNLDDPLVLKPGVTERSAQPGTWSIDLREMTREEAEAAANGLSSRIYGSRDGDLHQPLTLQTNYEQDVVLGVYVEAVCLCGGDFDIKIDGEFFHRLSWPSAGSTHRPETLYYFTVPAGERTVSFEITGSGGPVVVGDYTYVQSVGDFPEDRKSIKLEQEEPPPPPPEPNVQLDGYRGIWFTLGQFSEWGDKYSGGLGTYTMKHSPLAVYAPEVNKTFFTYGGTTHEDETDLLIMASEYDHTNHSVPQPTIVDTKPGVNDPHDNASIALDKDGYVWIFVSGRGSARPGFKYRSVKPYSVDEFEKVTTEEMTYPQPRYVEGKGFFNNFTKYTAGRELYWETSKDGIEWSEDQKLAGFGGHYQMTAEQDGTIITVFNYHPSGVDSRTNLYFAMTEDMGETWTTVDGTVLDTPLDHRDNPALVIDYEKQGLLNYNKDVAFDADGHPVVLHLTSHDYRPGPSGDPRTWHVTHWTGEEWVTHDITTSDHNYDSGSLYIDGDVWTFYGPTEKGPQEYQTGGEMAIWESTDKGQTWTKRVRVTEDSEFNHTYARRALDWQDPFFALWADGDPTTLSESRIYFGDSEGRYWRLPYTMDDETAIPLRQCIQPDGRSTVSIGDRDSGVENKLVWGRCSINDVIEDDLQWESKRAFYSHISDVTQNLLDDEIIDHLERQKIMAAAGFVVSDVQQMVEEAEIKPSGIKRSIMAQLQNAERDFEKAQDLRENGKDEQAEHHENQGYEKLEKVIDHIENRPEKQISSRVKEELIYVLTHVIENRTMSNL